MRAAPGRSALRRRLSRPSPPHPGPRRAPAPRCVPRRPSDVALVDAHCHLGDGAFDADREAVLARARAAGVSHVVVIGTTLEDSERAAALAQGRPGLSATAGVHPHEARTWSEDSAARLRALLARPEVVAVGETGLDYHYDHSPRAAQRRAFESQLALAAELGKPVVVHARGADHRQRAARLRGRDRRDRGNTVMPSRGVGIVMAEGAPKAIGPYSQAVIADGTIYTAAQIALDPKTNEMVGRTTAEQTERVLKNLAAVLRAAGSNLGLVVK